MLREHEVQLLLERLSLSADAMHAQASSIAELATGLKVNSVLYSGTVKISARGAQVVQARANFASATVRPAGADVVVSSAGEGERAPTEGPGVFVIPGDVERTVAIASNVLEIYGTPGTLVSVTLWIRPQPPHTSAAHPYGVDSPAGPQRIASAAASTVLAPANPFRRGLTVFNESTATLFLALAPAASLTVYTVQVVAGAYYELQGMPLYRGIVSGIWSAANGAALVTELQ
jgi:hypothetical protein